MGRYLINKYWSGVLGLVVLFIICLCMEGNTLSDALSYTTCAAIFYWIMKLIIVGGRNPRKAIRMVGDLFNLVKLVWYIISLKPLRRWLLRLFFVGSPKPYPYLALYGSLLDTHMMLNKFSAAFSRDKTPATRATVWRLLSRGSLVLGADDKGNAAIKVAEWQSSPSDGLDPDFERTVYNFIAKSQPKDGAVDAKSVEKLMIHYVPVKNKKSITWNIDATKQNLTNDENQYRFADLLNTGISRKAYPRSEVQHLFGMRQFLRQLPKSFERYAKDTDLELPLIWKEYMTYAYLFGDEQSTFRKLAKMIPQSADPLLHQLATSSKHRKTLRNLMNHVSTATPGVEDSVAARMGRMPLAWHSDELYDIQ